MLLLFVVLNVVVFVVVVCCVECCCVCCCCCQIVFQNHVGKYDLEVTTFQMAVLFTWNQRPEDSISLESLR